MDYIHEDHDIEIIFEQLRTSCPGFERYSREHK